MAFEKVAPQKVMDKLTGVSLEIVDLYSLRYTDHDQVATIDSEALKKDGKYSVCLYLSDLTSWDDSDDTEITPDEKEQIKRNVEKAFELLDADCEVS